MPPPVGPPQALCPADASRRIFDARVTTPIVVCTRKVEPAAAGCVLWQGRSARSTFKLTDLGVVADFDDAVAWQPPLQCEGRSERDESDLPLALPRLAGPSRVLILEPGEYRISQESGLP